MGYQPLDKNDARINKELADKYNDTDENFKLFLNTIKRKASEGEYEIYSELNKNEVEKLKSLHYKVKRDFWSIGHYYWISWR